jgi:hypothetical protein
MLCFVVKIRFLKGRELGTLCTGGNSWNGGTGRCGRPEYLLRADEKRGMGPSPRQP